MTRPAPRAAPDPRTEAPNDDGAWPVTHPHPGNGARPDQARPSRQDYRPSRDLSAQLAYLTRVIKAPTIAAVWADLADQARQDSWSHEEYLAAVLARQVAAREANGTAIRTAGAHFPALKTLEDFNLDHQPSLRRDTLAHLATCTFIPTAGNAVLLGPPGRG